MDVRVLAVEDEEDVLVGVRRALTDEGYDVDSASDGATGLQLALERSYSVIVLDVMLPALNGYEVCRRLRSAGVDTPILMLSAKSGEWDIAEGLDLGADDYLTKPFSVVELLARVRARARGDGGAADALSVGDLRFEPELRRCSRGPVSVDLSARETELLRVLFDQRGSVVSKRDLVATVWPDLPIVDANVAEVYVGRLRRKLDAPGDMSVIETVRGVGYRLREPTRRP